MKKPEKKLTPEYLASILKTVAQFADAVPVKETKKENTIQINI